MVLTSSMTPTTSAPRSAPGAEPMPPRIAAAKTAMMRPVPRSGSIVVSSPRKTPAPPASAPPPERGEADDPLGGQPLDAREEGVVGARAHGDAETGPVEEALREQHERHRDAEDRELLASHAQAVPHQRPRHRDVVAPVVVAPDEADAVLEDEGDADGRDGEGERAAVPQGAERDAIRPPGDGPGHAEGPEPRPLDPPAQAVVHGEGGEGADGEVGADREVGEAQQLPQEGEGDGRQRQDAAGHEAVEQVLRDRRHPRGWRSGVDDRHLLDLALAHLVDAE